MKAYSLAAAALLLALPAMAQKNELKAIEKSLKAGNMIETRNLVQSSAAIFDNATPAEQAQYYQLKGQVFLELAKKGVEISKNLKTAGESFQSLIGIEEASGKKKYSDAAKVSITEIKGMLINEAVKSGNESNFKDAYQKLYLAYVLDKTDPFNLYYAASYAVNAKEYDDALTYYDELKRLNFSGERTNFRATSLLTDLEENFATKADRDQAVKFKTHINPRDEKEPSKKGEIYGNYALILIQKGEVEKAKAAVAEARRVNPDDISLIVSEANMYYNLDDFDAYTRLINEAIQKKPNDAELFYNLGVVSTKTKKYADAERYYNRAIELKPDYADAYLNLAVIKLDDDQRIIDEMNNLGTSAADNKKYDALKKEREKVLAGAIPFLEKAVQYGADIEVKRTLMNIYNTLDMSDKYKALKSELDKK
jgi:tetratricopeptide (TPR) repeat protein